MSTTAVSHPVDDFKTQGDDAPSAWPTHDGTTSSIKQPSGFDDAASAYTVETLSSDPLEGFDQPLGLFKEYVRDQVTVLEVQEARASLTGKEVIIRDLTRKQDLFVRHAVAMSLFNNKEYRDAQTDKPLYELGFTWNAVLGRIKLKGKDQKGDVLLEATSKFRVKNAKMAAKFKNIVGGDGKEVDLVVEGDWWARKGAKVTHVDSGKTVALIQGVGKWKVSEMITARQLFHVTVAPGVDLALIAGIVNCYDEKRFYG